MLTYEEWCNENPLSFPPKIKKEIEQSRDIDLDSAIESLRQQEYNYYVSQQK